VSHVTRSGRPALIPFITDDAGGGNRRRRGALRALRTLGLTSHLCVPLTRTAAPWRDDFAAADSGRRYAEDDLRLRRIRARAALAVDNAQAFKQAQAANRLKDDFLATLSHELRTPLNAILGYARLLRSGVMAADRADRAIETVERNATSLAQIVEDILDVSRIVTGQIRLHIQPVDLPAIIGEAIETVRPAADASGADRHELDRAAPVSAIQIGCGSCLEPPVERRKFTPRGGRSTCASQAARPRRIVTDTGSASRRSSCRTCSSASGRATAVRRALTVGSASVWPSSGTWWIARRNGARRQREKGAGRPFASAPLRGSLRGRAAPWRARAAGQVRRGGRQTRRRSRARGGR
jgi:hypothetical protein